MTFTTLGRRIHLYLAMFLTPWILVFGISTIAMNHMPTLRAWYGQDWGRYVPQSRTTYTGPLPDQADPEATARLILQAADMDGAHWINRPKPDSPIVIERAEMIRPARITFTPTDQSILVERQPFQWPNFLRRLHVRRGYTQPYLADTLWAAGIDLFIVGILTWGLTGLWLWYKMKQTRRWGTAWLVMGSLLFALFVVTI